MSANPVSPPDFPVRFPWPEDAGRTWELDRSHNPASVLPLGLWMQDMTRHGIQYAFGYWYGVGTTDVRRLNTFVYATEAWADLDEATEERCNRDAQALLERLTRDLRGHWDRVWLPEITEGLDGIERALAACRTDDDLPRLVRTYDGWARRLWEIHFEVVMCAGWAIRQLAETVEDLFGPDDAVTVQALTAGEDTFTRRMRRALLSLREAAVGGPPVLDLLRGGGPWPDLRARLLDVPAGPPWVTRFEDFLHQYGKKLPGDLASPTWQEDPSPVLSAVASTTPHASPEALRLERERAEARAMERLAPYPTPVVNEFRQVLTMARAAVYLREEHNFYIDQQVPYFGREAALRVGARGVRDGCLAQLDDVFYLFFEELRHVAAGTATSFQAVVEERKAEMKRYAETTAPDWVGADPATPRTVRARHPIFGGGGSGTPVSPSDDPRRLNGRGASPGVVRGRVHRATSVADAKRLRPGEILVTWSALPVWAPYLETAGGVVAQEGGTLSHLAIMAREYGLPAVVGVPHVMAQLSDGEVVEVDGDRGVVVRMDESACRSDG